MIEQYGNLTDSEKEQEETMIFAENFTQAAYE